MQNSVASDATESETKQFYDLSLLNITLPLYNPLYTE